MRTLRLQNKLHLKPDKIGSSCKDEQPELHQFQALPFASSHQDHWSLLSTCLETRYSFQREKVIRKCLPLMLYTASGPHFFT